MGRKIAAQSGVYGGKFVKAGQSYDIDEQPLGKMTKAELLAEAEARGLQIDANASKAQIVEALAS